MRFFEIVLLVVVTLLPFVKRNLALRIKSNYILAGLGFLISVHLVIEGWRWQMTPAYLLVLILTWRILALDVSNTARLNFKRVTGFTGIVILAIVGWVLPMVLPVFTLPEPRGEYKVGSQMRHIKTNVEEKITRDPNDKREIMIKIWYPATANVSDHSREKYVDHASRSGFATKYGLPAGALNYLDRVETYVYPDIPVAKGPFPVLIFSHGYGSKATGYYALLTELTSQGYVVINMNHTYESLGASFPDGQVKYFDYGYQGEISTGSMEVVGPIIEAFKDDLPFEERHPIVREAVKGYFEGDIEDRWANDMILVLDLLEQWNAEGELAGQLDLDKVGVIGHSVGGGSAGKVAIRDGRVKAAVNLDGIQWGNKIDTTYHIPYLYVSADWPEEHEDINSHVYQKKSTDYFYEATLLKSGHPNFMDIPFMIPVPAVAGTGEIDPYEGMEIVTKLVTSFFDKHLRGISADPIEVGQQYELLDLTVFEGDSIKGS